MKVLVHSGHFLRWEDTQCTASLVKHCLHIWDTASRLSEARTECRYVLSKPYQSRPWRHECHVMSRYVTWCSSAEHDTIDMRHPPCTLSGLFRTNEALQMGNNYLWVVTMMMGPALPLCTRWSDVSSPSHCTVTAARLRMPASESFNNVNPQLPSVTSPGIFHLREWANDKCHNALILMHSAPCPHEVHTTQWRHEDKNRFNAMDGGVVQPCKTARHMQSLDSVMHLLF